jgi:hypothetical protein
MPANIEQLLYEFVDRETEMERFVQFLDDPNEMVMMVWGGGGIGKSSLQAKMRHEVAQRGLPMAEVIWSESQNHDYLAVMRKIRDYLGVDSFKQFTDLANFFTVPHYKYQLEINVKGIEDISVLKGASITDAQIGSVSAVTIKDMMVPEPREDMHVPDEERRTRLTDAFVNGVLTYIKERSEKQSALVFLDGTEKMTKEMELWLWEQLLAELVGKKIKGLKFVVCGRRKPELDRSWKQTTVIRQLKPLRREHIEAYLIKRGVQEGVDVLANFLEATTHGNMLELATQVDAYLEKEISEDDEW